MNLCEVCAGPVARPGGQGRGLRVVVLHPRRVPAGDGGGDRGHRSTSQPEGLLYLGSWESANDETLEKTP